MKYLLRASLSIVFVLLILTCFIGCGKKADGEYYVFYDDAGRKVDLDKKPERIIVLMGSYAEVVLNAGGLLAGASDDAFDDRNFLVGENVVNVGSPKSPNLEIILSLDPDFVVMSGDIAGHRKLQSALDLAKIPCAYFIADDFYGYLNMLKILCDITSRQELYVKNGLEVEERILEITSKDRERKKILLLRAYSSGVKPKGSDTVAGKILKDLGCINICDDAVITDISSEVIIEFDPQYIFVVPMGSDSGAAVENLISSIKGNALWQGMSAVKNDRLHILPKALFHYKPNSRWGQSYEYAEKILFE